MNYHPDVWRIMKLTQKGKVHYRVFAGWYGGFTGGDSWQLNSGITKVEDADKFYDFHGESGSVYSCHKRSERTSGYMMQVYNSYAKQNSDELHIELISMDQFLKEFENA